MDATCGHCGGVFSAEPNVIRKGRRFCSKRCWYAWHRGPNNMQTKRVEVACDNCGLLASKSPSRASRNKFNYCSVACARAGRSKHYTGENHPQWSGGALQRRGPGWERIRREVIASQGDRCGRCGMTGKRHKAKYGRSFSVHHRHTPFRLTEDNSRDNLVALCCRCHSIEEAALRRSLTPEELRVMSERTAELKASGRDRDDYGRMYDNCPQCGERKAKKAALCKPCRSRARVLANPRHWCPQCGAYKDVGAVMCKGCALARRRGAQPETVPTPESPRPSRGRGRIVRPPA